MIISELHDILGPSQPTIEVPISSLRVDEAGSSLDIDGREVPLDEMAERALARHLGVSATYLERCPGDLKAVNLNYWLGQYSDKQIVLAMTPDLAHLVDAYGPEKRVVPVPRLGRIITQTLDPSDIIVTLRRDEKRFHIDVRTETNIEVPGDGSDLRPETGDVIHGGVRIVLPSNLSEGKPSVEPLMFGVLEENIISQLSDAAYIHLKGMTVSDILDEIQVRIEETIAEAPEALRDLRALDDMKVPGNTLQTIRTLGQEHKLSTRVIERVMDIALRVTGRDHTLYDLAQAFSIAANSSVAYGTQLSLQRLAGHISEAPKDFDSRCGTCAHLLRG